MLSTLSHKTRKDGAPTPGWAIRLDTGFSLSMELVSRHNH